MEMKELRLPHHGTTERPSLSFDSDSNIEEEDDKKSIAECDEWELSNEDLIGDYTRPYVLPRIQGRHPDLATISSSVLSCLLTGVYDHCISSYRIIDCRYPYEFDGGHILSAINLYKYKHIYSIMKKEPPPQEINKSHLLIFYCEFSSSRAPRRLRFLRKLDRDTNVYPNLRYPECYLLHGGYKDFFLLYKQFCIPPDYRIMKDPDCIELYLMYKTKTRDSKIKLFERIARPIEPNRRRLNKYKIKNI